MFRVGDMVKVIKLISDENGYVSMPEHAIGNIYEVVDIQDETYKYGLNGIDEECEVYFREEELELVKRIGDTY